MTKSWQLRAFSLCLTVGLPFAASCAREANTVEEEGDDASVAGSASPGGNASGTAGSSGSGGSGGNAGATSGAFGGTNTKGGSASSGGAAGKGGSAGKAGAGGGSSGAAGNGGALGTAGKGGSGGAGGSTSVVPPDVLARASAIVYYETQHASAMDGTIQMKLFIQNQSSDPLLMDHVKIRYWFTAEVSTEMHQYYHGPDAQTPAAAFVNDATKSHALMTFGGGQVTQGGDRNDSEIQLEITNNGAKFNQADDYSWQPADATSTPNPKITLYLDDKLIWGCEPSGVCFDDGAGGAGSVGAGGAP